MLCASSRTVMAAFSSNAGSKGYAKKGEIVKKKTISCRRWVGNGEMPYVSKLIHSGKKRYQRKRNSPNGAAESAPAVEIRLLLC